MKRVTITIRQFCRRHSIGKTKAYELIREGQLETIKVGRKRLVKVDSAERFVEKLSQEGQR